MCAWSKDVWFRGIIIALLLSVLKIRFHARKVDEYIHKSELALAGLYFISHPGGDAKYIVRDLISCRKLRSAFHESSHSSFQVERPGSLHLVIYTVQRVSCRSSDLECSKLSSLASHASVSQALVGCPLDNNPACTGLFKPWCLFRSMLGS